MAERLDAEEQLLYEAVLRVIDDGCKVHGDHNYILWGDSKTVNDERCNFAREVVRQFKAFKESD